MRTLFLTTAALALGISLTAHAQANCPAPEFADAAAEKISKNPLVQQNFGGIASKFGFPCLGAISSTLFEYIQPETDINNWQNLFSINLIPAPQSKVTVNMVANSYAKRIESAGGKFKTTQDSAGRACFDYSLNSPKGPENSLGCVFRPDKDMILIIQKQSRTPYTPEASAEFLQAFNALFTN